MPKVRANGDVLIVRWNDVLYANIKGAKYSSQSKVESSQKELKYLAMVLLATSA